MAAGKHSAGIVLHRRGPDGAEILLVHPGGPFWANKEDHAWSIPKGEFEPDGAETAEEAAIREFAEELGQPVPDRARTPLPPLRAGAKTIHAWLVDGDLDPATVRSNTVEIEWPPRSGRMVEFPEVDRAAWFSLDAAATRLHKGQVPILRHIAQALTSRS